MPEGKSTPEQLVPKSEQEFESTLPPKPPEPEQRSKRKALIKGIAALAVTAGAALWGSKEIKAQKEGIDTQNATFIPLYERHDVGFAAKDIPSGLDIMFKEGMPKDYDLESPPYSYIRTKSTMPGVMGGEPKSFNKFQDGVLEKLAQNNIGIANADINPGVTIDEARRLIGIRSGAELLAAAVPWTYAKVKEIIDESEGNTPEKSEVTRRKFLKAAGIGMAGLGASYIATNLAVSASGSVDQNSAVKRIIYRINGFQSNFHPEDLTTFFRNVIAVEKMLSVAEQLKSEKNKKLKIGFNYGAAHNGMEDLLQAGPDFCRAIISSYPKEYLQHVIGANSSLENLCSVMVVNLPKDFKSPDLDNYDKATNIPGQRILDKKLFEKLQEVTSPTLQKT